jgi:hypothetical protein
MVTVFIGPTSAIKTIGAVAQTENAAMTLTVALCSVNIGKALFGIDPVWWTP